MTTQPHPEPQEASSLPVVAYEVYVAAHQRGYCVLDEDDAQLMDDCTNHGAVVTPLTYRDDAQSQLTAIRAEVERLNSIEPTSRAGAILGQMKAELDEARGEVAHLTERLEFYTSEVATLKAAPVVDVEAVIDAGGAMANAMFNLAQWEEERLTRSLCERFKSMQVKWDAARSALRSAIEGTKP